MLKEERQDKLKEYLYKKGQLTVHELCDIFHVSHDTIRRDLIELEEQGDIKRVFGGAILSKRLILDYQQRVYENRDKKVEIAKKAISLLKNNQLIAIDGGTTNTIFASMIPHYLSLTIITNSFHIANELKNHKNIKTIVLGGEFFGFPFITGGSIACEQMEHFCPDYFFLGADSIHHQFGMSVPYYQEVSIKRKMCLQSKHIVCLCIQEKLKSKSQYKICDLDQIDFIITENQKNEELTHLYPSNKLL